MMVVPVFICIYLLIVMCFEIKWWWWWNKTESSSSSSNSI